MKKNKINSKNKKQKKVISFVVINIFLLVISSTFVLINRNYFILESFFKEINLRINKYIIDNMYTNKDFKNNMINSKTKYLEYENNILKKSLRIKESNGYVIAEVINHTSKYFFNRIEISKGRNYNIKKSDAVVTDKGLIGFISKVGKNTSEVSLLTNVNENNMMTVVIEGNDKKIQGVLKKYDPVNDVFEVSDIVDKSSSLNNLKVFLLNYNNNLYNGIYIGTVKEEKVSDYGLSKTLIVKQDVDYNDLLFVWVVR